MQKRYIKLLILVMTTFMFSCHKTSTINTIDSKTNKVHNIKSRRNNTGTASRSQQIIIQGKGAASVLVGDTAEDVVEVLGKPTEQYNYDGSYTECIFSDMHWIDYEFGGDGIFAFLNEGKVYHLSFSSSKYSTEEGISLESFAEDIVKKYKDYQNLQKYVLLNSGGKVNGGEDLIYWVEQDKGIAFELYYDKKSGKRRVWSIDVFDPQIIYQPKGCVSPPQSLKKIE